MLKRTAGFTLIELMIVVVVIGILASIAVPAYQGFLERSRRSDAITALLNVQMAQEKFRANCTQYAEDFGGGGCGALELDMSTTSQEGHYSLDIDAANTDATGFVVEAAPLAGGAQANDDCGTFAINQDGPDYSGAYADSGCWGR